jgi:hypothetical protein
VLVVEQISLVSRHTPIVPVDFAAHTRARGSQ